MLGMSFLDSMTGFVVGSNGGMSKTTDGGATWAPLAPPQTDWPFFQMKIISAVEIYAVGAPDFLYKSTDLGSTWTALPILPVAGVSDTLSGIHSRNKGQCMTMSGDFGVVAQVNRRWGELDIKQFPSHDSAHVRYPRGAEYEHRRRSRASTGDHDAAGVAFDEYG